MLFAKSRKKSRQYAPPVNAALYAQMKIVLWIVGVLIFLFLLLQVFVWWQDQYVILQETISSDGKRTALLIGNHGGGAAGYCRDLVYNFPYSEKPRVITSNWAESKNKDHLVKVVFCGDIKKLRWEQNQLTWENKGSIPDY